VYVHVDESLHGMEVIKAFNAVSPLRLADAGSQHIWRCDRGSQT
jgi:hypothetical protein